MSEDEKKPNVARKSMQLSQPTERSKKAVSFLNSEPEASDKQINSKLNRAIMFYMSNNDIPPSIEVPTKRLNVEIPLELHNFINSYVRSCEQYGSLTELTIDLLTAFAKEHGFRPKRS